MSMNDPLSNVLSHILNCDKLGKENCLVSPKSNVIVKVLDLMKREGMIKDFKQVEERAGGVIQVDLQGRINKCGVVKPRFSFTKKNIQDFEKRYLLGQGFGFLIVTTPKGIMTHSEAIEGNLGGKLVAYCY